MPFITSVAREPMQYRPIGLPDPPTYRIKGSSLRADWRLSSAVALVGGRLLRNSMKSSTVACFFSGRALNFSTAVWRFMPGSLKYEKGPLRRAFQV